MKEPVSKCCFYAMSYINRYPKTEKELFSKLLEKKYSQKDVDDTIKFLKFKGFVDDENFVRLYIGSEIVKKGKPVFSVKKKLFQKGVDKKLMEKVFQIMQDEIQSGIYEKIKKEIEKYKKKGEEGFDILQRLMKKGYQLDDIKKAIGK